MCYADRRRLPSGTSRSDSGQGLRGKPNPNPLTLTAHFLTLCSADGSIHTESNKLYRKVKHRARPNLSSRERPKRAQIRRRSRRQQRRVEPHTEHGLGVLLAHDVPSCSQASSFWHIKKRFVNDYFAIWYPDAAAVEADAELFDFLLHTVRLLSVVAPLLALCSCEWFVLLSCACACDLLIFLHGAPLNWMISPTDTRVWL